MRRKISFEERLRSQLALKVAMKAVGALTINAFASKLELSRKLKYKYLSFQQEGMVDEYEFVKCLQDRQEKVDDEVVEIDKNTMARAASESDFNEKDSDEEHYWNTLINPVRFHRIDKGKATSKAPPRILTTHDKVIENTVFDIKNIWYFLKPYAGESAYFSYKFGPSEFYCNDDLNLWNVLFDKIHPDDVVFVDSIYNPFHTLPYDCKLMSAQELSKELLAHYSKVGPNWLSIGQGFGTLLIIAILKLASREMTFRKISKVYSDQLYGVLLENDPLGASMGSFIGSHSIYETVF